MSDLILGYIKNRITSDYYRTITEAVNDVIWLIGEVERLQEELNKTQNNTTSTDHKRSLNYD